MALINYQAMAQNPLQSIYGGGGQTSVTSPGGSNLNPNPQSGVPNPFGGVPGPIALPNPAGDLGAQYPNLGGTNAAVSSDIYDKLNGYLSPTTLNSLQTRFGGENGVRSGMPGSGLNWNSVYGNIIGAAENQKQQGLQDYNSAVQSISGTQTVNPALQAQIAETNAINKAAPNPALAQTYAQSLFDKYLNQVRGANGSRGNTTPFAGDFGSPSGGTGALGFGFNTLGRNPTAPGASPQGGGNPITEDDFSWLYGNGSGSNPITENDFSWLDGGSGSGSLPPISEDDFAGFY